MITLKKFNELLTNSFNRISVCVFIVFLNSIAALDLVCDHQINTWTNLGSIDECIVRRVSVPSTDVSIDSATFRWSSVDKDDIESFYIYKSPECKFIPKGIETQFKNIKVLVVAYTGLTVLRQEDLKPLTKLQNLYVDNNHLEVLDGDLFAFNPNIDYLNFSNNQIKTIIAETFLSLKTIKWIDFSKNICIDRKAETNNEIIGLLIAMKINCAPINENLALEQEIDTDQ
jgi:Leucine-rich repeat (LRR) protein